MMTSKRLTAILLSLAVGAAATAAHADAVKYRRLVMRAIGGHMGAIVQIAKGAVPHTGHMLTHAKALEATIGLVKEAFKNEAMAKGSRATEKIWSDWTGFTGKADNAAKAANVLVGTIENNGNVGGAIKGLGKACGACHKAYRKKKKKR